MSPSTPPPAPSPSPGCSPAPAPAPSPRPVPPQATSAAVGQVLVIDDDAMFATAMVRTLDREHQVTCCTSGAAALALIAEGQRFDVILCDLTMPQMSGVEFFEALQRAHADQARKVIFLTGGGFTPRMNRFLDGTANLTLEKPLNGVQLRALVNQRVGAVRAAGDLSSLPSC